MATTVSTFGQRFAEPDYFCNFPSEKEMGITKKMLKRFGLTRPVRKTKWTDGEISSSSHSDYDDEDVVMGGTQEEEAGSEEEV